MTDTITKNTPDKKKGFSTIDLSLTAMMAVLMTVCSWISIPTTVPFTLQTFAVFCALGLLGGKRGFFAVLVYIMLGAFGVPVFAEFTGGPGILLGSTGGYIVGFLFMAAFYWLTEKLLGDNIIIKIVSMICGLAVMYAFGTVWFLTVYARTVEAIDIMTALKWCVFPFVLWDLIKLALAVSVSEAVKRRVRI